MKASLKSRGSILSHVTSGTWEEDADIEDPHQAEEMRKTPRVLLSARFKLFQRPILRVGQKLILRRFVDISGTSVLACRSSIAESVLICASS